MLLLFFSTRRENHWTQIRKVNERNTSFFLYPGVQMGTGDLLFWGWPHFRIAFGPGGGVFVGIVARSGLDIAYLSICIQQ